MPDTKSKLYDELANGLQDECLQEAADTLFGKRREMEHEISLFYDKVDELKHIFETCRGYQRDLQYLLLQNDPATVRAFYTALDVDSNNMPNVTLAPDTGMGIKVPGGLTLKGRYFKAVSEAYTRLATAIEEFLYGRTYSDPKDPRVKRITVNRTQISEWCEQLNQKIDKMNQDYAPSQSLDFARRLNVGQSDKADKMACTLSHCNLDKDMAFPHVQWGCLDLPDYPELPSVDTVKKDIKAFCSDLVAANKDEIKAIIEKLS